MEGMEAVREEVVRTPFGEPSDRYILGRLHGRPVAFLARHGRGHRLMPSELNFRANIFGFKVLGTEWILSASAVGSMREEIKPLDILIPDQFFDRTTQRVSSFFGNGLIAHVSVADPTCEVLGDILYRAGRQLGAAMHRGGTYLCIEGPQFSTRAESRIYRNWGVDVIGMTNLQEAKLAREAEICYATMALVTDYDVWHATEEDVNVEAVVKILLQNVQTAKAIVRAAVADIPETRTCPCAHALRDAIITARHAIPAQVKRDLAPIVGKYLVE
jgi:5'-methylthioadenosine phosphorylase